jgi:ubiquinone/menaquinone biosynthesis C-methylase UbiE
MPSLVEQFYDENVQREWERLDRHRTEFAVTLRVLADHLPPPPAAILDIGGGPGRYAIELAQQGYTVTLADLSGNCLAFAESTAKEMGVELVGYLHADARDLSVFAGNCSDAALLMGPLYHLIDAEDRRQAVREVYRVLRRGGLIFASIITRCAPVRWAAKNQPSYIFEDHEGFDRILATGVNIGQPGAGFTNAYFMHPSELQPLMEACGFATLELIACEGVVSMIEEQVNALTGDLWQAWVDLNYRLGKDPGVHGAAEHLLYVGRK